MAGRKTAHRFGPLYLDEFGSWEVRSLSAGARDLWSVLAPRTRSGKHDPAIGCVPPGTGAKKGGGWYVSYEDLAKDLARPAPSATNGARKLIAMSHKAIQRRMRELREAGLVRTWWDRPGHQMVALLRPPSLCELCAEDLPCVHTAEPMENSVERRRERIFTAPRLSSRVDSLEGKGGQPRSVHPCHRSNSPILNLSIEPPTEPIQRLRKLLIRGLGAKDREHPLPDEVEGHYPRELGCSTWCDLASKLPMVFRGWAIQEAKAHSIEVPEKDILDALLRDAGEKAAQTVSISVDALRSLYRLKGIDVPEGMNPAAIQAQYGMELAVGSSV